MNPGTSTMNESMHGVQHATAAREPVRRSAFVAALVAPWYATKRHTIWLSVVLLAVCGLGALAIAALVPTLHGQITAVSLYAAGIAFAWAFWGSGLLLVARDGWRLGVPHATRNATASVLLYAVISIALPVLPEAAFGWNVAPLALIVAVAIAAGLAFVLLPRWIAVWLGFLPALYGSLQARLHLAAPSQPAFLHWAGLLLVVLLVPVVWSWWRLLRGGGGSDEALGWNSPMILQLRKQATTSAWAFDKQLFWREGKNQARFMTLHGIDTQAPAKAIEVALGGMFVPRTAVGNLRRLGAVAWPMACFGIAMVLQTLGQTGVIHRAVAAGAIGGAMWGGLFGVSMSMFGLYALLNRRWNSGAEPALMALLPGLGQHAPLHRSVACAAFTKPLLLCVALWLMMVGCEWLAHFGAAAMGLTTVVVAVMCLLNAACLLRVFAGRPVSGWVLGVLAVCVFGAMMLSIGFAVVVGLKHATPTLLLAVWGVTAAWALGAGGAAWFAWRAWRSLAARPHPFLAGAR